MYFCSRETDDEETYRFMDAIGCVCANAGLIVASRTQSQFIVGRDRVLRLRSSQLSWAPLSDSNSDSRLCIMSVPDAKNADSNNGCCHFIYSCM
ncbi:MAG: hypothetical protein IKI06_11435 [Prevotella sp.]|nr:hypothetical protein [Prevotella sp.]